MIAIHLDRISVTYIAQPIFEELSWEIHTDRCVGLVGPNGCGKSTLLKVLVGTLKVDDGHMLTPGNLRAGYLAQDPELDEDKSVWEEALSASTELRDINRDLATVEEQLGDPHVYNSENRLAAVLDTQTKLLDRYTELDGPSYEGRVRSTLEKVGFQTESDQALLVSSLSGGQKKLLGLTKLLVTQPDILLLDEPDNHLDLEGKQLLEQMIRQFQGAVVIVSHDRYLLDLVVDEIAELEDGKLTLYPGDYSQYAFEKETRALRQQQLFQAQHKEITRLEQAAKRLLTWGKVYDNEKLIKRGRNILKRIDRIDRIEKPVLERRRMGLQLEGWRGSNKVLEIQDLDKVFPVSKIFEANAADEPKQQSKNDFKNRERANSGKLDKSGTISPEASASAASQRQNHSGHSGIPGAFSEVPSREEQAREEADEKIVLAGLDLLIWHGERVGLVGPNGAGKSVLFRLIRGEDEPTAGEVKIGPSVSIGYYAQEHEILDYDKTLIDTVRSVAHLTEANAVSFLGQFLFSYQQARGYVRELSGGERSRLQMALLTLSNANFLLLDEPTNNLDIPSAEVLEDTLGNFEGTVFVISHDRYFLDRVVDRIVELDEGQLNEYIGNYSDYQAAKG